jgi:signal transduction histidine kinase
MARFRQDLQVLRLLRFSSLAGLVAILATLLMLFWFYRQVAIEGIVELAERTNLILARSVLNSVQPELLDYLQATAGLRPHDPAPSFPPGLAAAISGVMQDPTVARIRLYNRQGNVVYPNNHHKIGGEQGGDKGFVTAINGGVVNNLVYRDSFNSFDGGTEVDNLMQTYLPVRSSPFDPVQGVFEIYTDVNHLASQMERTEFIILLGALLILTGTYAAVMLVAWRAGKIIELQQRTIRERTQTLEVLSAQMLKSEESHKKKIAFELHEGLAQTLSAIKLHLENHHSTSTPEKSGRQSMEAIIPALRDAIQEVRTIATELRPSSIDDVGLLLTLSRICRDVGRQHPPVRIELQTSLHEQDIPARLKIIIYRIVASVLNEMAQHTDATQISIALWRNSTTLSLMIDDTASEDLVKTPIPLANIDPQLSGGFARMEELTTLSGGEFSASHHSRGGATLRASWNVG